MADAVALVESRVRSQSQASSGNFQLSLDLVLPAVLLGLLRVWSLTTAPKQGAYFTAEVLLIAYGYFAVVRAVHLNARSRDGAGCYDRTRALKTRRGFYREVQRYWRKIALWLLPLLLAALVLDVATAESGLQRRPNVHLSILFIGLMVWARYGAAVIITSARWTPPWPPRFAHARGLASGVPVVGSFALVNVVFCMAAVAMLAAYKWAGVLLPSAEAEIVCLSCVFTALAWLALWMHCRWSLYVLPLIEKRPTADPSAFVLKRAA